MEVTRLSTTRTGGVQQPSAGPPVGPVQQVGCVDEGGWSSTNSQKAGVSSSLAVWRPACQQESDLFLPVGELNEAARWWRALERVLRDHGHIPGSMFILLRHRKGSSQQPCKLYNVDHTEDLELRDGLEGRAAHGSNESRGWSSRSQDRIRYQPAASSSPPKRVRRYVRN